MKVFEKVNSPWKYFWEEASTIFLNSFSLNVWETVFVVVQIYFDGTVFQSSPGDMY